MVSPMLSAWRVAQGSRLAARSSTPPRACHYRPPLPTRDAVLLFEASTPLLHLRKALIQAGRGSGVLFFLVNLAFSGVFIAFRLVLILAELAAWANRMRALLDSGRARSPEATIAMLGMAAGLTCLNGYWAALIIKSWVLGALQGAGWTHVAQKAPLLDDDASTPTTEGIDAAAAEAAAAVESSLGEGAGAAPRRRRPAGRA